MGIQQINVRVNQGNQQTVHSTSTFIGAANVTSLVTEALQTAQAAANTANTALQSVDSKVSKSGDTMTGNLIITSPGVLQGKIDGGTFS
jgi:hypothetical protein